jgi:hypothetical protein
MQRCTKDAIDYIKEQLKLGARKNEELYRGLLNNGLTQLSKEQIAGLKQRVKVENGDKEKSGFEWRKILEWCNSHSDVPDDEDQVFCVDIDYELMKANFERKRFCCIKIPSSKIL